MEAPVPLDVHSNLATPNDIAWLPVLRDFSGNIFGCGLKNEDESQTYYDHVVSGFLVIFTEQKS